jgi:hypothetical protein
MVFTCLFIGTFSAFCSKSYIDFVSPFDSIFVELINGLRITSANTAYSSFHIYKYTSQYRFFMSIREEIIIKLDTTLRPGWSCPACGGMGHKCDGSLSIGPDEIRSISPTPCHLCNGKGRVKVLPLED